MPIYEYRCDQCGHKLEVIQKMSDDPLTNCPDCGEAALRKLVSAAGFHLKGSGWYVTDFRDKKKKTGGEEKGAGAKETGGDAKKSGGEGKADSGGGAKTSDAKPAKTG